MKSPQIRTAGGITFTLALLAIIIFSAFKPQEGSPKYVTLNSYEFPDGKYESKIVIIYENGEMDMIKLDQPNNEGFILANAMKIHESINLLSHKGYSLVSASREPQYGSYIFEKR